MPPRTLEFMLNGMQVGCFEAKRFPECDGEYEYEPYRGLGHYELAIALLAGQMPDCYYETKSENVFFAVSAEHTTIEHTTNGPVIKTMIQLSNFRRIPR